MGLLILHATPAGAITVFGPLVVKGFGYDGQVLSTDTTGSRNGSYLPGQVRYHALLDPVRGLASYSDGLVLCGPHPFSALVYS